MLVVLSWNGPAMSSGVLHCPPPPVAYSFSFYGTHPPPPLCTVPPGGEGASLTPKAHSAEGAEENLSSGYNGVEAERSSLGTRARTPPPPGDCTYNCS